MAEQISIHMADLADIDPLNLFLYRTDNGDLLNTGGDALTHVGNGRFTITLDESRYGLGPLYAVVYEGAATPANVVWDGWLSEQESIITDTYPLQVPLEEIAANVLLLDWTRITGPVPHRSALNALRHIRNRWAVIDDTKTVYKEDNTTPAYTSVVTLDEDGKISADYPDT